ncbi:MAG: hypothetical protein D6732_13440 [Methanobacteriota archaeon]|nr:MAG: hypothetical protein D6732_13440 [Euryarchaeota archaeon]
MGKELEQIYNSIEQQYGKIGLYRLIVKTKISKSRATSIDDTPEVISLVKRSIDELGFEFVEPTKSKSRFMRLRNFIRRKL